ncbi:MAG: glycosyltransferase family 4 protein [Halioglobus sp.]
MIERLYRYRDGFRRIWQKTGFIGAVRYSFYRLLSGRQPLPLTHGMSQPVEFYRYVYAEPFGDTAETDNNVINWVIPEFQVGSGGHLNIFRVIKKLEDLGFVCRINIDGETHFTSAKEARDCVRENFFPIEAEVSIGRDGLLPAAATFATGWDTAYTVRDFRGSGKKYYFVQDFEPDFFALGSEAVFAENTYRFGFRGITAGDWLAEKLRSEYDMETSSFGFSYDHELYKPHPRLHPEKKRVFFYARPVTPRRGFELGILTLNQIHQQNPDIEFVLAGWDLSGVHLPFPCLSAGVVSLEELPDLYSQCDVALVLSLTNLSLLPLEAMACGCAVVSSRGANAEWLLNDDVVKFADLTPEALSTAILDLFAAPEELASLKRRGLSYSQSTSWETEVDKIAAVIREDLG